MPAEIPSHIDGALVTATAPLRGRDVLIGDSAGRIFVLRAGEAPDEVKPVAELTGKIMDVGASVDGSFIAAVSVGGDHAFGQVSGPLFVKDQMLGGAIGFDLTNTRVAFGGDRVVVYSTSDGRVVSTHDPSAGGASQDVGYRDLAFTPDGNVVGAGDGADAWGTSSSTAVQLPVDCSCVVSDVALSANGAQVVFGTPDGHLIVIDSFTGQVLADETVTIEHNDRVRAVAASDDGSLLIGVSQSGKSVLWDATVQEVRWRGQLTNFDVHRVHFADHDQTLMISQQVDESDSGSSYGLVSQLIPLPG